MFNLSKSIYATTVIVVLLVILITPRSSLAIDCGTGKSHNSTYGSRQPGDRIVFQDHIRKEWKLLRYAEGDAKFPLRGQKPAIITKIEAIDQYTNGHGGCAYITEGGVGQNHVNVHIKSEFNRGIDFLINIYGK
uniref:Heteropteran venom family 3 protein 2 n=1 Tax=Ectomocoris sp. TaxID=3104572 RepID=A0AB38ZED1_9HEMI